MLARRAPKEGEDSPLWDRAKRAALRAEAAGPELELAPCGRVKDLALSLPGR